jgi:hypothetical protein
LLKHLRTLRFPLNHAYQLCVLFVCSFQEPVEAALAALLPAFQTSMAGLREERREARRAAGLAERMPWDYEEAG